MAKGTMAKTTRKAYPSKRGPTVKKPYGGSRYGNDAFVKIENTEPLSTTAANAN